jgi:(R)-citramalate synthase
MKIEIMDTTLRDGEQTSGVAFTDKEKLAIATMLLSDVKVDRIEIASARVSKGEYSAVELIIKWALQHGHIGKIEVLGFVDGGISLEWIRGAGGKCINLLTKGSLKHVQGQLRKTPDEHIADVIHSLQMAENMGISTNVYLEDWSSGMRNSKDYVFYFIDRLKDKGVKRFMLPDTLGILNPEEVYSFAKETLHRYPGLHFEFHGHNDYDFAVANAFAACSAGFSGVHTSVNGLGERAGNTILSSIVPVLRDHLKAELSVDETKLNRISTLVESFSGIRICPNCPVIGANVFTQTAGVHADGDKKGNLYFNDLMPERFGRTRTYALGKTSGKANIQKNLEELGIELDHEVMAKVVSKVISLGDKKKTITKEDLPYIIRDILGNKVEEENVKIANYYVAHAKGLRPVATLCLNYRGTDYEGTAVGDGQYDAFVNAIKNIYEGLGKSLPRLVDYMVSIPPGGKTDALVETSITWDSGGHIFKTRGLDPDQTAAAIIATEKMLNLNEK